ncbi:ras-related protein Rab-39B [Nilaparvata lugens]|uniref:Ras superfamily small GTPase Rab39 n=1 Tax=Nilaparvata lugens TaxID=108931 RepID=A0A165VGB2_NILLU|nr:ras-related protein Rab-39B [Nilaparvata lugens]AMZ00366.1 Ras superfamily small GTPase Rab39 [Nilaparvata lugens]
MVDPIFDYQFRLILIGDSTVGKSSLLKYFTDGKFAEISDPTVGVDFFARLIEVKDGARIKLQLWDTAGQERFRSITKSYYRNSVGALLVYDVCNRASFEHIPAWMMEARRHIEPHRPVFALVGCKLDLVVSNPARREVTEEEVRDFAQHHDLYFVETSAKTGHHVEEAFNAITQEVYNRIQSGEYKVEDGWDGIKTGFARPGGFDFNLVEAEPAKSSCC